MSANPESSPRNRHSLSRKQLTAASLAFAVGAGLVGIAASIEQSPTSDSSVEKIPGFLYPGDAIYEVPNPGQNAYITIDDCNNPAIMTEMLDMALEYKNQGFPVSFTFFPLGTSVANDPEVFIRAITEGHEIGNHTIDHKSLANLRSKKVNKKIKNAQIEIKNSIDPALKINLFRAPGGDGAYQGFPIDPELLDAAINSGLVIAGWNKDSNDWRYSFEDEDIAVSKAMRNLGKIKPGDIMLFHANYENSSATVKRVIEKMKNKGLTADETLSEGLQLADNVGVPIDNNSEVILINNS